MDCNMNTKTTNKWILQIHCDSSSSLCIGFKIQEPDSRTPRNYVKKQINNLCDNEQHKLTVTMTLINTKAGESIICQSGTMQIEY